jgi:hypothetical protein
MDSLRLRPAPPNCRRLELRPRILGVVGADLPSMYDVCGHADDETRPSTGLMSRERGASLRLARLVCDRRDVRLRLPACDCKARVRRLVSSCPTMTYLPPWCPDSSCYFITWFARVWLQVAAAYLSTLNWDLHTSPHHMPDLGIPKDVNHSEQFVLNMLSTIISRNHNLILAPIPAPWYHIRSSHLPNRTPTVAFAAILSVPPKAPLTSS